MAEFTENFELFNFQQSKHISIVVTIDGVPGKFSNRPIFQKSNYGDPTLFYGQTGLVYGQSFQIQNIRDIISISSSMSISQRLEPEQGKGSVSTLSIDFVDKDAYMTKVISPGVIVDEILGKNVTVELGYEEISYPGDFFTIFRGFVSNVEARSGLITIQLSDSNLKRRQQLFFSAKTQLSAGISTGALTIPVLKTDGFHQQILGPDATYDPAIKTYIKVDDEFIEYGPSGISGTDFVSVTRAARNTTATTHDIDADVTAYVQIEDHAIDMALKLMLSGWGGNWISNVEIFTIGFIGNPNAIAFSVDLKREYGLVEGDYITISGSAIGGNNITTTIVDFQELSAGQDNYVAICSDAFTPEGTTTGTAAFRSQYDTYPSSCGLKMDPREVDVQGHLDIKSFFLGDSENSYSFLINAVVNGKSFIESEVYLPVAAYSVTRRGRCSVKITKAPIADAELQILDKTNILNPADIRPSRGTSSRKFFNEVVFNYDLQDDLQTFSNQLRLLDSESLNLIGISSVLPISSRGAKSSLAIDMTNLLTRRANFLLSRYRRGATQISLKTMWQTGSRIEAGDIIGLDGTDLEITDFETGTRQLDTQLFEVVDRTMNIKEGTVDLKLINGVGASVTDRFGTVSPSSVLDSGCTETVLFIVDSFSATEPKFPLAEPKKWKSYIGLPIAVHDEDYTFYEEVTLLSIDPVNNRKLITNPLSSPPPAGYIIEIGQYPGGFDPSENSLYKAIHGYLSPTVSVVAGIDAFSFTVAEPSKFVVDGILKVHNDDYTIASPEVKIVSVIGTTITVAASLGFTPSTGQLVELIGFLDSKGSYRFI